LRELVTPFRLADFDHDGFCWVYEQERLLISPPPRLSGLLIRT